MKKARLLKLAGLLEADAADPKGIKFDLRTWGRSADEAIPVSCGTKACAMGLAALSGAFKGAGLTWTINENDGCGDEGCAICSGTDRRIEIFCGGEEGFGAAAKLFGISDDIAAWLFSSYGYKTLDSKGKRGELAVAARIRGLVDGSVLPA